MFDDAEYRYTIALVSVRTGFPDDEVRVHGPYNSLSAYLEGIKTPPGRLPDRGLLDWTESASFPLIPSSEAAETFVKMRSHPNLGDASEREISVRPVGSTVERQNHRKASGQIFQRRPRATSAGSLPVIGGKGFNLWEPETGDIRLGRSRMRAGVATTSTFRTKQIQQLFYRRDSEWIDDPFTLPVRHQQLAFRDVTNRTNSRTVIAALVPPNTVLNNTCPYLILDSPSPKSEALYLGVLCSTCLDWYARRVVELHVNFYIFNNFPFPLVNMEGSLERRVIEISGRLAAVDNRFAEWAADVGVPVGSVTSETEKRSLVAELDAVVAHLYGLDVSDLETIWSTFHTTVDHLPDLNDVKQHFERWST